MSVRAQELAGTKAIGSGAVAPPPSRTLADLIVDLPDAQIRGSAGLPVSSVRYRSDDVGPGALFFCVRGSAVDGHAFAGEAVSRGAVALVVDHRVDSDVTQVLVRDVREAMGPVSAVPGNSGGMRRITSPAGCSTLITSAP